MNCKNILLDTDIGPDCDDVGALALLNLYADAGCCNILGIGHCTSNPYGAGVIDAICRYYGRPDVSIGTYSGKDFLSGEQYMRYNRALVEILPNRYRESQPEDAVGLYRRILAAQPDHSVDFIAIGPLNNLSDLLNSQGDEYSPLTGVRLVEQKVVRLVTMAGIFRCENEEMCRRTEEFSKLPIEEHAEYNVWCDVPAAQNVADNWPTPKVYLGFEAGLLKTGGPLQGHPDPNHPVRLAYKLYTKDGSRYSWDLLTVEYALVPGCPHYKTSEPGRVCFDDTGRTLWEPLENGTDHFIELAQPDETIIKDIDEVLMRK